MFSSPHEKTLAYTTPNIAVMDVNCWFNMFSHHLSQKLKLLYNGPNNNIGVCKYVCIKAIQQPPHVQPYPCVTRGNVKIHK